MSNKLIVIGKAMFINFDDFIEWYKVNGNDWGINNWTNLFYGMQEKIDKLSRIHSNQFKRSSEYYTDEFIKNITQLQNYILDYNLSFELLYNHELFDVIRFGNTDRNTFIIPNGWLNIEFNVDYSEYRLSQLRNLTKINETNIGTTSLVPMNALTDVSIKNINDVLFEEKNQVNELLAEMDNIKNSKSGELIKLQAEIDEKMKILAKQKQDMMAILDAKKAEMQLKIQMLENQLFVIETEIYGIRCFLGEVVDFIQIRKGKEANIESPIVLFQKVRYLDEELGKMASIYNLEWNDHKEFELFLKHSPEALETFCLNDKCITLIRMTKDNKVFGVHSEWENMLGTYEIFHGTKIGIIVRNGDNVFLGWTDDDMINIKEDMFYVPSEKQVVYEDNDNLKKVSSSKEDIASRYFIFSILQGLLEYKNIISLPEPQSFTSPSKYIIYSAADNWISDNRFGDFSGIVNKVNENVSIGEMVLFVQGLTDRGTEGRYSDCSRSRNYANRTHDCNVENGKIYTINLIENNSIFVSVEKSWSDKGARSNFEVYKDEFINLTYMNSVWLKYAITNRNIGNWRIGGRPVNFAYAIKYLNIALQHIKQREKSEFNSIIKYYTQLEETHEWQRLLSEWKLEKQVKEITEYQAKRFVKWLSVQK